MKKLTNEQFLERARKKFGDKFEYLTPYGGALLKIKIACLSHGIFNQSPSKHLITDFGCPKCCFENRKITTAEFVESANIAHNFQYTYPDPYIGWNKMIRIECKEHGPFSRLPRDHVEMKRGCPECLIRKPKKTHQDFLNEAFEKHGNKFTYPEIYAGAKTDIRIICIEHGEFWMTPDTHLHSKTGCQECSKIRPKKSTETYINEAHEVHNFKYRYLSEYEGAGSLMTIECPIHGEFKQCPINHLQGKGCFPCSRLKMGRPPSNTQEFIEKADALHPDKFDYSLVSYINNTTKIKIICKDCGEIFEQQPNNHLQNQGCPPCGGRLKWTTEKFIEEAIKIHGNRYGYALVNYVSTGEKVKIICNECGDIFDQRPYSHVHQESGCAICSHVLQSIAQTKTTEQFIIEAKLLFGDQYDYSLVKYITGSLKVIIRCNECGFKFNQCPQNHLSGRGCPKCAIGSSQAERDWLTSLGISKEFRQFRVRDSGKLYFADGFDPITNTLYEFNGDYWHGNPAKFDHKALNKTVGKTFGDLFKRTKSKEEFFIRLGFNVVSIWEADWLQNKKLLHK